jgi:O-acetyl-ADP-ribose deacetylase (regulator of RNase III)
MVRGAHGNLLDADVDALVNTVNTVGVMGKGIALQFKRAYPDMFKAYAKAAKAGDLRLGLMHVYQTGALSGPQFVINFPTKVHWRAKSRLEDVRSGLIDLVKMIETLGIKSVAIPPLGCGNGGLDWREVEPIILEAFCDLPDVDVLVYPPAGTPAASEMQDNTKRPRMTVGKAALVEVIRRYHERSVEVSLIEVQKLMYFLQAGGEDLRLRYVKDRYGPYADNLRHVLRAVEGHFLIGYGDASATVHAAEPIDLLPGAAEEARIVLGEHPETGNRIDRVLNLVEGFESPYALELLVTVHWIAANEDEGAAADAAIAARIVGEWSHRKQRMFGPQHVAAAWRRLHDEGWLRAPVFA